MTRPDLDYYRRRLTVERHRADIAVQPEARCIHSELADRYAALIGEEPAGPLSEPALILNPATAR